MIKKCHKCQQEFNTNDFFCKNCGSILYEEPVSFKQTENVFSQNSVNQEQHAASDTDNESENRGVLGLIKTYLSKKTLVVFAYLYIVTVVLMSVVSTIYNYNLLINMGELINMYDALYYSLQTTLQTFFNALPGISILVMRSGIKNATFAARQRVAVGLGYIRVYYIIQAVFAALGLALIASIGMGSLVYGDIFVSAVIFIAICFAAVVIIPYVGGAISTYSALRKNVLIEADKKISFGKTYCIYAAILNILTACINITAVISISLVDINKIASELSQIFSGVVSDTMMMQIMQTMITYLPFVSVLAAIKALAAVILLFYLLKFLIIYKKQSREMT